MRLLLLALLVLLFSEHTLSSSAAIDTLSRGHVLAEDKRLVSDNGKFAVGFFQTGSKSSNTTLNSYLGIWFNEVPKLTPVWTANRDNPVIGPASPELMLYNDGNLVITAQSTLIWSTRANITAKDTIVILLDNGNLILRSSSNSSHIFWQSFDHPTDTILPGAKFGWNKVTGLNRHIVARKNLIEQASGVYSSEIGLDGIGRSLWNSSVAYCPSGQWNGRFFNSIPQMSSSLMNFTFVNNNREVYFTYNLLDEKTLMYIMLDVSGQMKQILWIGHDWFTIGNNPDNQCSVYAVCGPFTICTAYSDRLCDCMKGFSVRSPEDYELEDRTGGCIRNTPLNCDANDINGTGMLDKFYPIPSVRLSQSGKVILNASSANECSQVCLRNCSCTAYSYDSSRCSVWHDDLLDAIADDNGEILYIRLAAKEVDTSKRNKSAMIIGVSIGVSIAVLGFIFLTVIWRRRKGRWSSRMMDNDQACIGITAFRYIDLQRATKNFSEKLGTGGFGSVFKGSLSNWVHIAVKRLDGARQGEKQFRAEVNSIGIIQHINLVKLIGFCCQGDRRLLVYEHMPNSSLDVHLFQESHGTFLNWSLRYQIALGVARGLAYLHHGCRDCIIHCDIKPQNILLDACFIPKIADFGMVKFLGRDFSRAVTTMRGTVGYLAPEWISGTAITSKVDVYSYGMVLLEIISGRRNTGNESSSDGDYAGYFPVQVAHKLLDGDVESLVDANLHGDVILEEVERVCKVACWCIQDSEFDRPNMGEVVQLLEGIFEPNMPPMPRLLHAVAGGSHST